MGLDKALPQTPAQAGREMDRRGEAPETGSSEEAETAKHRDERTVARELMEHVVHRDNLLRALKRVRQNKGSAGVDGMRTDQLGAHLRLHWPRLREQLLAGAYQPQPVRRCEIPKTDGSKRMLGIPTVLDRFIQQALLQVLQPIFDPTFSAHSYGFRPGRSAHDAIVAAQRYVEEGRTWVVDVDLEKFFDRVNHDVLMARLAKRIEDRRMLKLIRAFLAAGMMAEGVVTERDQGTPQGGPLSPLLANLLLDEVDKEIEKRGHAFVRYADDCNVYVRSERAAHRVMEMLRKQYASLRLQINETKSAVAPVWGRKFLGYRIERRRSGTTRLAIASKAERAIEDKIRRLTARTRGHSVKSVIEELTRLLRGWKAYFRLADARGYLQILDQWIRHRLRTLILKQWKRRGTIYFALKRRDIEPRLAWHIANQTRSWWKRSLGALHRALPNSHFDEMGLIHLAT